MKKFYVLLVDGDRSDTYAATDLGVALSLTCADDGSTIAWGTVDARDAGAARIAFYRTSWQGKFVIEGDDDLSPVERNHAARSETHPVLKAAALEGIKVRLLEETPIDLGDAPTTSKTEVMRKVAAEHGLEVEEIVAEEVARADARSKLEQALEIVETMLYDGLKRDGWVAPHHTGEDGRRWFAKERARNIVSGLSLLLVGEDS